jgi:hypothetical protein
MRINILRDSKDLVRYDDQFFGKTEKRNEEDFTDK